MYKTSMSLALLSALALSGCGAGEEPYHEVHGKSPDQIAVDNIGVDQTSGDQDIYLYRHAIGDAPRSLLRNVSSMLPDNVKMVTLRRTEKGIQVLQLDGDNVGLDHKARFDTENNLSPVFTLTGDYVDYRCTDNKWGECTNQEQENNDRNMTWDKKKYFIPDYSQVLVSETTLDSMLGFGSCAVKQTTQLVPMGEAGWSGHEIDLTKGVLNFEVKHTYTSSDNWECLNKYYNSKLSDGFDGASFTVTEYFSVIKRDNLVSKDYKAIPYAKTGDMTYGFFTETQKHRDDNYNSGLDGNTRTYMKRFNPAKKELVYELTNNFYDPKNQIFLDAAKEAEAIINVQNTMYKTGVPTVRFEKAEDKRFADLRYNFIKLFDQPLDNGLLGVANMGVDPLTGEIISAGVNQYSANFLGNAQYDYDRLVRDFNRGRLDPTSVTKLLDTQYPLYPDETNTAAAPYADDATQASNANKQVHLETVNSVEANKVQAEQLTGEQPQVAEKVSSATTMPEKLANDATPAEQAQYDKQMAAFLSEHNMLSKEAVLGGNHRTLPWGVKGHAINWKNPELWVNAEIGGQLKAYADLPASLGHDMVLKTAGVGFVGTLLHEFGHSLGLRHNFAASRDEKHLFTHAELEALTDGFTKAGYPHVIAETDATSQMEYAVDMFGMSYGPYDLAALRYGYAREVGDKDGHFHSLKKYDQARRDELAQGIELGKTKHGALKMLQDEVGADKLVDFDYCTDGNVSLNSNCNRFDAGYTNDQIAQYYIERYFDQYKRRNSRFNKEAFYEDSIGSYVVRRIGDFDQLHTFAEDVDSLQNRWGDTAGTVSGLCASNSTLSTTFICDIDNAQKRVVDFFLTEAVEPDATVSFNYKDQNGQLVWDHDKHFQLDLLYQHVTRVPGMTHHLKEGQIVEKYSDAPEVFNEFIFNGLLEAKDQKQVAGLTPVVTVNGRFLNNKQAPVSDAEHPYSNETDLLGTWADRLLSVRALVSHHPSIDTSSLGYQAMVDDPEVNTKFKAELCRAALSTDIMLSKKASIVGEKSCDDLAGLELTDADKTWLNSTYPLFDDMADQYINALPSSATGVARYFGFDTDAGVTKGKINLLHAMLMQVKLASTDSDSRGLESARLMREFVGVHKSTENVGGQNAKSVVISGHNMVVTPENVIAMALLNQIEKINSKLAAKDADKLKELNAQLARLNTGKESFDIMNQTVPADITSQIKAIQSSIDALGDANDLFTARTRDEHVLAQLPVL